MPKFWETQALRRECGHGLHEISTLLSPCLRYRAYVWVSSALEVEVVFAGLSSSRAAALQAAACLGSVDDTAHHNGTPVEVEGGPGAPHSTDRCIASFGIADLDSSPAAHSPGRTRRNPAGTHTGYHIHYTVAAAAAGAVGAGFVVEAFAAEEALAISDLVADRSRTAVVAEAADSDVAAEGSREWPWLRCRGRVCAVVSASILRWCAERSKCGDGVRLRCKQNYSTAER